MASIYNQVLTLCMNVLPAESYMVEVLNLKDKAMTLDIIHDEEDLRFYAVIEGDEAELTYTYPESGVMDFDHTFVPESDRGNGYADQLVQTGLEYARSQGYQIVPSCPVVEAYIKRHSNYKDLVQPE